MAYKNSYGDEVTLYTITISASCGEIITYSSWQDLEGKWHGSRTKTFLTPFFMGVGPFNQVFYNWNTNKWMGEKPGEYAPVLVELSSGSSINLKVSMHGSESWKELVGFSYESENRDYAFRTKLHCDTPKSKATISYEESSYGYWYVNGNKINELTYIQPAGVSHAALVNGGSTTTYFDYNCGNKTIRKKGKINIYCSQLNLPNLSVYQSNSSVFMRQTVNGGTCKIEGTTEGSTGFTENLTTSTYFSYVVDGEGLNNTDNLTFIDEDGNTWEGLNSPVFRYDNSNSKTITMGSNMGGWTTENISNPDNLPYTTRGNTEYTFTYGVNRSVPSVIGNITCTNPQLINPYTQGSTTDAQGRIPGQEGYDPSTTTQVVNNIFKIVPNLNCESRRLLSFAHPTLANSDAWELVNCHLDDNNEVIVDGENPYIYQDFYRPKYTSEIDDGDVLAETDYRQRHFTHYRYMNCNFIYRDITEPQVDGEYVWHPYRPDISLICKPYGDIQGHTWTAKFDDVSQNYDLLMCNANADSTQDEMSSVITPKFQKLYDTGITYFAESPITEFGYLPNIVGRVKIPISTNSNHRIQLGTLTSYYSANIQWREKVADVMFVTDLNENDFTPDYTEGRETIDIRIEEGKIYFNESVTNPTITITTSEETLTPLSEWGHNSNFNINSATINMSFSIDGTTYTNKYTISFPTSKTIINFKDYNDGDKVGIEFKYYSIDNEDIAIYFYRGNTLMVKARYDIGMQIDCGSEFQEPLLYGQDNPGDLDDVTHNPFSLYHNRFILMTINGARSVEIPEVELRSGGNWLTDTFTPISMYALYTRSGYLGDRHLFFRDDLNEIQFNLSSYTPDASGNYHINALTQGTDGITNWLKRTYKTVNNGEYDYYKPDLYLRIRVDTIHCSNMARYISGNGHIFKVVADYGASIGGVDLEDNPNGNITDTSPYANSGEITFNGKSYYSSKHGTQTTINLNNKTRQLTKCVDGCKYHFSIIKVLGYIWRGLNGLIYRNNNGDILQGGRRQ